MSRKIIKITIDELDTKKCVYHGIDIDTDKPLFKNTINSGRGICEFIGAIHGLMYIKKNGLMGDVLVKNEYIKSCVENKSYKHQAENEKDKDLLKRAQLFLLDQKSNINIYLYT